MNIEDTNKISNLDILNTKCNFKILVLSPTLNISQDDETNNLNIRVIEIFFLLKTLYSFFEFLLSLFSIKELLLN